MVRFLRTATRGEFSDQGFAQFRPATTAILDQETCDLPHAIDHRPIDDGPAVTFGLYESGAGKDGEMRRHGVLRYLKAPGDLASRKAIWLLLHQETKRI
ncbi:hypothetical protein WH91_07880 [Devosia psychrophila]|uniref:Uncharacterized protein n=1 Tax=Devosia psychrophila TaxID=728005 RepID=A0ABR5E061_9HYPH|nr:hypothetical protein WH91_07880 [Devosia psychrophila]